MLINIPVNNYRIDESLGFLVNRLAAAMKWAFESRLEEFGLTAPQYAFLAILFREDEQPLNVIGKVGYCDKPTITGIANRLEKKGLIKKVRDEKDRRVIKAVLTKKGRGLKDDLLGIALHINAEAVKGFTEEEVRELKGKLKMALNNALRIVDGGVINV